jgi:hypothetical protein
MAKAVCVSRVKGHGSESERDTTINTNGKRNHCILISSHRSDIVQCSKMSRAWTNTPQSFVRSLQEVFKSVSVLLFLHANMMSYAGAHTLQCRWDNAWILCSSASRLVILHHGFHVTPQEKFQWSEVERICLQFHTSHWIAALPIQTFNEALAHSTARLPLYIHLLEVKSSRSHWPRGFRNELSSFPWLLGSWVRIPLKVFMTLCAFILCVSSCV